MDYTSMMQGVPPMGMPYNMVQGPVDMSRPRHAYSYPYDSDPVFLMPQIPPPHHHRTMAEHQSMVHAKQTEPKPRLAKDEVQLLESEFLKNPKPSSQRKREIAALLKVENPRINNWFQNRRAKAKQMLRREADPRAAGDESPSESSPSDHQEESLVSEYYGSNQQSLPLRASSAAFPTMGQPSIAHGLSATDGSVSHSTSPSGDEYPSPGSHDMAYAMHGFLPSLPSGHVGEHAQHAQHAVPDFEQSLDAYVPYTTSMGMEPMMAQVGSFQAELLSIDNVPQLDKDLIVMPSCEVQQLDPNHHLQVSSPASAYSPAAAVSDLQLKSPPPPANLATRRNKGAPTLLNAAAFRSGAFGPKTGLDLGKRTDGTTPIRRIASATGLAASRIQKHGSSAAPHSPLCFELSKEASLHSLQTAPVPLVRPLSNNVSPVIPSEALATVQAGVDEQQFMTFDSALGDYLIKTEPHTEPYTEPHTESLPGTPAYHSVPTHAQHLTPWMSYAAQDASLLTPGLGSYSSDEFSLMQAAPAYTMSSQSPTPSIAQQPLGSGYIPLCMPTGAPSQTDYTFPGEAYMLPGSSVKSLPDQLKSKHFQFTQNVTPQDYSADR